jgi:hypothetical protein
MHPCKFLLLSATLALAACNQATETDSQMHSERQSQGEDEQLPVETVEQVAEEPIATSSSSPATAQLDVDPNIEVLAKEVRKEPERDRAEILNSVRTELRIIDAKIDALALRTEVLPEDVSPDLQDRREEHLRVLREHRASVDRWMQAMQSDSDQPWEAAADGFAGSSPGAGTCHAPGRDRLRRPGAAHLARNLLPRGRPRTILGTTVGVR